MNAIKRIVLSALVLALLVPAASDAQYRRVHPWHFSIEAGLADPILERRGSSWDEALQLQGSVGYDFFTGSWGVLTGELALGTTVSGGDFVERRDPPRRDLNGDWDVNTIGLFLTYRTDEVIFYPLARIGVQNADLSISQPLLRFPGADNRGDDDTGVAAGFGAGFRFTPRAALELTWTRQFGFLDEELDVIALGVRF